MGQKITIVGAGKVGSSAAFNILSRRLSDVVLIDTSQDAVFGEALDLMQAAPAVEFDGKILGTSDMAEMQESDLVIVTAGQARRPGMTRLDLAEKNAAVIRSIVKEIVRYAPGCWIMVVTNPVDVMTLVALKESGFEINRVFGMGSILDTLRFRSFIAHELGVSREDVRALVIGEHGDHMVPLVNYASVSGIPVTELLDSGRLETIIERTKSSGARIIRLKGGTVYAPAVVIAGMAEAIIRDRKRVMAVSVYLEGEYGIRGIAVGVPCILGGAGIERIIRLELDRRTAADLDTAAEAIRHTAAKVGERV